MKSLGARLEITVGDSKGESVPVQVVIEGNTKSLAVTLGKLLTMNEQFITLMSTASEIALQMKIDEFEDEELTIKKAEVN